MNNFMQALRRIARRPAPLKSDLPLYKHLKETCDGFDDPEERCPQSPSECFCYPLRTRVERARAHG